MEIVPRHRPVTLLVIVVMLQVLLLAFQIKRQRDVRLIRLWSVELLTPAQRAGNWLSSGVWGGWVNYIDLRNARQENDQLRRRLGQLELRNRQLESKASEQQRLQKLLGFRESNQNVPMIAGQVIGASADSASQTLYINRGEHDGLRRNQAVITPDGVVGKIVEVYPSTAQVLLMTDRESGVGVLLDGTRTQGVLKGLGEPQPRLDYVVNEEAVKAGEQISTSGQDRIFPKDLPVGTVVSVQPGNPFQLIRVQPAAHLDRLEEVLVLLTQKELNSPRPTEERAAATPIKTSPLQALISKPTAEPPSKIGSKPAGATAKSAPPASTGTLAENKTPAKTKNPVGGASPAGNEGASNTAEGPQIGSAQSSISASSETAKPAITPQPSQAPPTNSAKPASPATPDASVTNVAGQGTSGQNPPPQKGSATHHTDAQTGDQTPNGRTTPSPSAPGQNSPQNDSTQPPQ